MTNKKVKKFKTPTHAITVNLPIELWVKVSVIAQADYLTPSDWVRQAIRKAPEPQAAAMRAFEQDRGIVLEPQPKVKVVRAMGGAGPIPNKGPL